MQISVVLCTFNGALFIQEQLQSIAQQTRMPDEVLIFDDRSTDSTVDIAKAVCTSARLNCAVSINEIRLGIEQNFSQAMCKARGDIIFFCDQDDVWLPARVEKMIAPFQADSSVSLVYSDGYIVGPHLEPSGYTLFNRSSKKKLQDGDTRDIGTFLRQGRSPGIKASTTAFAAWVRDLAGPIPEGAAHDSWIAFFGYALGKVVAIDEPLHYYRRHDHTCGKSSTNELFSGLKAVKRIDPASPLREKALLAQCLYDRLGYLEDKIEGKTLFSPRFKALKLACQEAARTLKARAEIVGSSGCVNRMLKGVLCLARGDYVAMKEDRDKLRVFCRDIGLSALKEIGRRTYSRS